MFWGITPIQIGAREPEAGTCLSEPTQRLAQLVSPGRRVAAFTSWARLPRGNLRNTTELPTKLKGVHVWFADRESSISLAAARWIPRDQRSD